MADSGVDVASARAKRPGSSRVKNIARDAAKKDAPDATERAPAETPKSIKEVNGFKIIEKIGQGGMGAVYKASQTSLDRVVALKILPPRIARNSKFIERFQREARTSAKLCHPNLVQGIDVGQDPVSKLWYFAMEFVDGPSLRKLLKEEGRIDEPRALRMMLEVARALDAINSVGMIHRDIKPDNILLSSRGEIKVADFGLSRAVEDDSEMTNAGSAVGTPNYMAPEQVRGLPDLDIRCDLYALGATLFHIVTGEPPFKGKSSADTLSKHITDPVPLAHKICKDVSEPCSKLIVKLMEKKREDRIQTPQELVARLDALLDPGHSTTGKRNSVSGKRNAIGGKSGQRPSVASTGPLKAVGVESTGPLQRVRTTGPRAAVSPFATTGSAEPVGGERRADPEASAKRRAVQRRSPLLIWGLIAVAAVGIGAFCYYTLSKNEHKTALVADTKTGKPPAPTPAPAAVKPADTSPAPASLTVVQAPSRDDKAQAAFKAAQELEKSHPEDYAAIIEALKESADLGRDLSIAAGIATAQKTVEARWTETFAKTLKTMTDAAAAASARGDFAAANDALKDDGVAVNLRVLTWSVQMDAARNAIRDAAEAATKKILEEAENAARPGDDAGIKAALEKLKIAEAIPPILAPSSVKIADAKTRWTADLATLAQKADAAKKLRFEKGQEALAVIRKELAPLMLQSRFSAALDQLERKLQDPALTDARESLAAEKADLDAILALRQRAFDALRAAVGKTVTLNRGKSVLSGKIQAESTAKSVNLKLAEGPEMSVVIEQLEGRDIDTYAPPQDGAGKAEDLRRRGLVFLAVDDLSKSGEYFKSARDSGLGDAVKPYQERVAALELVEAEKKAQRDWTDAEALFQAKHWEEALRAYTRFKEGDAKSQVFAQQGEELKKRLDAIDSATHPIREGLAAVYYHGAEFKDTDKILARIDRVLNFDWSQTPPAAEVPHDSYCVRWLGLLKIPKTGHYAFGVDSDDGVRIWLDGKPLVDNWNSHGATRDKAELDLPEGLHDLKIEYYQGVGGAVLRLVWSLKDAFPESVVPPEAFWHDPKQK